MSVLFCSRKNCENIMYHICDRLSNEHGYICGGCFEELVELGPEADIKMFMSSEKRSSHEEAARARFNVEFPIGG